MHARVRAVVTAGGTEEPIDDVRVVANSSTGRFGCAIARALFARGVDVTVLGSRDALRHEGWLPGGIRRVPFRSHIDLWAALEEALVEPVDVVLMAAAVADYAPDAHAGKLPSKADTLQVSLSRTPKLIASLRTLSGPTTRLVGFKLLSGVTPDQLIQTARGQLVANDLDLVVANDLAELDERDHPVTLVGAERALRVAGSRDHVADAVATASLGTRLPEGIPPFRAASGPRRARARVWWRLPEGAWTVATRAEGGQGALAHARSEPWHPIALGDTGGVLVAAGEQDAALAARAWTDIVAVLGDEAVPVHDEGTLVAGAAPHADGWRLVTTGLGDDEAWPHAVLPRRAPGTTWYVSDPAPWRDLGFAAVGTAGDLTGLRAPWDRHDTRPAASAALVDVASRRVLLGRRRVPPVDRLAFPGGRCEPGEDVVTAARRELLEETGLIAPEGPPHAQQVIHTGSERPWALTCSIWYVLVAEAAQPTPELDAAWWPLEAALHAPDTLPGVRTILRGVRRLLDHP